jgi:formylglycine-generating enzyme required for sulfatase activity
MRFALVPAGSFWMGAPKDEDELFHDEQPRHLVTLTRSFYLAVHPVTQEQYERLIGHNPSHFCATGPGRLAVPSLDTRHFPVERVAWDEAVAFCVRLSDLPEERRARRVYRLPTEAEWEYACRGAGTSSTPFSFGPAISTSQVNFDSRFPYGNPPGAYLERPQPVGAYPPNVLGLYEMHGNIWERCADWFDEDYYYRSPSVDPRGPPRGEQHVLRGGSWYSLGRVCRSACRNAAASKETTGFRVALCAEAWSLEGQRARSNP